MFSIDYAGKLMVVSVGTFRVHCVRNNCELMVCMSHEGHVIWYDHLATCLSKAILDFCAAMKRRLGITWKTYHDFTAWDFIDPRWAS